MIFAATVALAGAVGTGVTFVAMTTSVSTLVMSTVTTAVLAAMATTMMASRTIVVTIAVVSIIRIIILSAGRHLGNTRKSKLLTIYVNMTFRRRVLCLKNSFVSGEDDCICIGLKPRNLIDLICRF